MGHRSIAFLIGVLFAFVTGKTLALGLGKITLESALNQPLQAEIELFEVRELAEEEIRISIASREDFERIGVDKVYFLSDLKFDVVMEGPRSPYITVTSNKAVREPFLNFVLQVQWPSGKLLREYTLLMDLPVFADESPAGIQTTTVAPIANSRVAPSVPQQQGTSDYNPRSEFEQAPPRPSERPVEPTYTESSYRVQNNDTLWEIAAMIRPDASVSIHQTMLAIQRSNPEAFINNNINLLKAGKILRIPERQEMSSLAQREAIQQVAYQNSAWSGGADVADAQLSGTSAYSDTDSGDSARAGRVKLTSPDDLYGSTEGRTGGGAADSSTDALENELAITLEQLDKSGRENVELRSKVSSLEEQIETMERMLEVSNENLRALELSAKHNADKEQEALAGADTDAQIDQTVFSNDPATDPEASNLDEVLSGIESQTDRSASETPGDQAVQDELISGFSNEGVDTAANETVEPVTTATPQVTQTPDPKKVVLSVPETEKGILEIILDNVLYIAGGLVLLAGGAFFLMRQKSSDEEDFDDFMRDHAYEESSEAVLEETSAEEDIDLGEFAEGLEEEGIVETEQEAETASDPETEDVVAEADIYIAYGKLDQAEEMLVKALSNEPGDEDARLKLLEVYSNQGDAESFDPHYAKLRVFASPATIERADSLRDNIPNIAEFDESSFDTSDVAMFAYGEDSSRESGDEVGLELAEDESEDMALDLDLGDIDSEAEAESGFELNLSDESAGEVNLDSSAETVPGPDEGLDLDFELDLGQGDDESSFDLELDLPEATESDADNDAVTELEHEDFDIGDLDLDVASETGGSDGGTLEDDLASLDADLDLSLDGDEISLDLGDTSDEDTVTRQAPPLDKLQEATSDATDFEIESDLGDLVDEDLDLAGYDGEATVVSSDTVVNEALNDEYIEQKLSEDVENELQLNEALPLEEETDVGQTQTLDALDLDEETDLDLSSLDEELDALTSDFDVGMDEDEVAETEPVAAVMEEPVIDFDDFDDELEKDEAMAETVKSVHAIETNVEDMGEDTMFDQAISEVPATDTSGVEFELPAVNPDEVSDDDLDFLSDSDETATKLDLARAYIDMGDQEGARDIIREIMGEGSDQQKTEAENLLARIDG